MEKVAPQLKPVLILPSALLVELIPRHNLFLSAVQLMVLLSITELTEQNQQLIRLMAANYILRQSP